MINIRTRTYWNTIDNKEDTSLTITKKCDILGCPNRGEYRAPKSRYNLKDYYWFCLDHVREYNQKWDFFQGMSQEEIEKQVNMTLVGDRPTWRATEAGLNEDKLRETIHNTFRSNEHIFQDFTFNGNSTGDEQNFNLKEIPNTAIEALKIIGLEPPIIWKEVRKKYKSLVKKYHPDTNAGDKESEEKLKQINLAYSILKMSYKKFEELD